MWLALRFPNWALDWREQSADGRPTLVVETVTRRQRVIATNRSARANDVHPGMGLADARTRLPEVIVLDRNRAAETAAMARLAGWAWRYSSQIHWAIADHDIQSARLIVEIGASLRLFGGQRRLLAGIRDDLDKLDYPYRAGVGNTPQAALAFSRGPRAGGHVPDLAALPLRCLALETATRATLEACGFRWTGEVLALPAATLARRFGHALLDYFEQLRGRRPHGLSLYQPPSRYRARHELVGAVKSTQGLIFALHRIFRELALFLRGLDSAIQTLRLHLAHEHHPTTRITLHLSAPSHDARHLERVAHERLENILLVAPVLEIGLVSDRLRPIEHRQQAIWRQSGPTGADTWPHALDRLRARLGHRAVHWLEVPADHRPENATTERDAPPPRSPARDATADALPRPFWLIEPPEPLSTETLGSLSWINGPERIESGWWDTDRRRDYFRAMDAYGRLLWLFRDLTATDETHRYFLHGLFG